MVRIVGIVGIFGRVGMVVISFFINAKQTKKT